jgi:two-component system, OmpR family, response regulator QseB
MRLLLAEDDARLAHAVRTWMSQSGIGVDWVTQGCEIEPALRRGDYHWMVLDLGLPDIDGEEVLKALRSGGLELPVIVMTARGHVQDRVRLLNLGADDFLVKPVHLDELVARLQAVRRRSRPEPGLEEVLRHGPLCLMPMTRTVTLDGDFVPLTNREYSLLESLMRRPQGVVSREQLADTLSGGNDELVGNSVDVHVHHLRRKLGRGVIRTVRGVGYTLDAAQ